MIKSFSGQVVFYFAILRAITAYVGENWLSQYITRLLSLQIPNSGKRIPRLCIITSFYLDKYQFQLSAHDIYTVWYTGNAHFLFNANTNEYRSLSIVERFHKMADHFEAFDSC